MRRFAIGPERIAGGRVTFDALETRHLARVLRLRVGDTVVATDGAGHDYTVRLETLGPQATGVVLGLAEAAGESPLTINLLQGLPKGDKLETIVRAATELGVARVVPVLAARSVVRLAEGRAGGRHARWQRVAQEAAKQCGRPVVPEVTAPRTFDAALDAAQEADLALCLWEGEAPALATALARADRPRRVAMRVGPEGGLEQSEVDNAQARGWHVVSLGSRVLRTETAAPALIAILQSRWGDLGTG